MRRILTLFAMLIVVVVGILFAVLNADPVVLNYYFGSRAMPLSLVLVLAMLIGAILGVLACSGVLMRQRHTIHKLRRSVELAEKEVENLRAIPIRDEH